MKRAGSQREQDGRDSSLATTGSSIKQQYRTVFCALNHTRSSFKPAIYYADSGLSFDASSEVYRGEALVLAAGSDKGRGGSISVWEEGVKRAGQQRERDGGDSFLAATDSIEQQYRTAFCALNQTRSSYKPAIYMDSGLSFDASLEVCGGGLSTLELIDLTAGAFETLKQTTQKRCPLSCVHLLTVACTCLASRA